MKYNVRDCVLQYSTVPVFRSETTNKWLPAENELEHILGTFPGVVILGYMYVCWDNMAVIACGKYWLFLIFHFFKGEQK